LQSPHDTAAVVVPFYGKEAHKENAQPTNDRFTGAGLGRPVSPTPDSFKCGDGKFAIGRPKWGKEIKRTIGDKT
jgi:hypothetical protein